MRTTEFDQSCPYAGLRSFTEEESLYFKGRDFQTKQVSDLLEQNKFLMVTGASGEGKSSLIYAGLIPNMRAGFFKSHYTNWIVADFRPERNPLSNMAGAIADALGYEKSSVVTELKRGFSSLTDLYINSDYFIDETDPTWTTLGASDKKARKRNAANLVVIIDQFEEFFTNPENFSNQIPSHDSQIVVNLALETARIALSRNLPLYVVFTMRSDFIGQCVAFRGLPEYIGFSQFFVPRLKRKDFKQVIEEPAILSGNRISQRLIERLVYDIAEGVDQLPVLQHALSQIWLAAKNGEEEMDLIHYAIVGGMPRHELPDEDQPKFSAWFESLPEFKKEYFNETGLHKIIEVHANTLYEGAWEYYNSTHTPPITISKSKRIIALTFACLTKIDDSRAVRNRMTLEEISNIINDPELTADDVGDVLSIFREQANSFIRPYKSDSPDTHKLTKDTVLDITHEALIRNWDKLNTWAQKEYEFYSTWLDFKKQLHRWKESGKRSEYLLPIGPLTYFENWYSNCKPNEAWIKRYDDRSNESSLTDIKEFMRRSSRKVIVSRTFMKYGTQRVVTFSSILILLLLSGFYWNDAENKRNERIVTEAISKAHRLLASESVNSYEKASYLMVQERHHKGTLVSYLDGMENQREKLVISIDAFQVMLVMDNHFSMPVKKQLSELIEKQIKKISASEKEQSFLLRQTNRYLVWATFDNYYNPSATFEQRMVEILAVLHSIVLDHFRNVNRFVPAISPEINFSIQFWLTLGKPSQEQIRELLELISPFEKGDAVFKIYYAKGNFEPNGNRNLNYNGGYHTLASLYSAVGEEEMIIKCFEKIKELGDYFVAGSNGRVFNNYNGIIGYLYQFNHEEKIKPVLEWIIKNFPTVTSHGIYRNMLNRSGYLTRLYFMNFTRESRSHRGYIFPNLYLANRNLVRKIADDYLLLLLRLTDKDERNFNIAMNYKRQAIFEHKYCFDRGLPVEAGKLNEMLDKAWSYFGLVEEAYKEKNASSFTIPYWSDGFRQPKILNKHLFIYPDYMDGWFSRAYHSDFYFRYMDDKGLIEKNFKTKNDLYYLHFWLAKGFEQEPRQPERRYHNFYPFSRQVLDRVSDVLTSNREDANWPTLILANLCFQKGDTEGGISYFSKLDLKKAKSSSNQFEYLEKTFFINQLKDLSRNLVSIKKYTEAADVIASFEFDREKAFSYLFNAEEMFAKSANPQTFTDLDSAFSKMQREDFTTIQFELDYRFKMITLLSKIGGEKFDQFAKEITRDLSEGNKFNGILSRIRGIAAEGNYYSAFTAMPSTLTETQEIICLYYLLWEVSKSKQNKTVNDQWRVMDEYFSLDQEYIFYVPF